MRLFEAITEANHRAVAGDKSASVCITDFADELPVIALTCVDPRLNPLFPAVLGLPGEQFIWLRNAGNIITGTLSSTMRSLALACAVKGGREIAIIGHTDCQVARTSLPQLMERFKNLGVERRALPENVIEYFGLFGSERNNVLKACDYVRRSPLIGPAIPVHGLLVDVETGRLDWLLNGYQQQAMHIPAAIGDGKVAAQPIGASNAMTDFKLGEMKFPEMKIGETVAHSGNWLLEQSGPVEVEPPSVPQMSSKIGDCPPQTPGPAPLKIASAKPALPLPPKIPPPIRPNMRVRRGK
jgi:carbonic anhydrase